MPMFAFTMIDSTVTISADQYDQARTSLAAQLPNHTGTLERMLDTLGYATRYVVSGDRNGRIKESGLLLSSWHGSGGEEAARRVLRSLDGIARGRAVWVRQTRHGEPPAVFAIFFRASGIEEAPVADYTFGAPETQ